MRPFNLIPAEERGGRRPATRTGFAVYGVVGGLSAALVAVVLLAMTGSSISDRRAELRTLEAERTQLARQTAQLAPYTTFSQISASRVATVGSLARSRFDWARVLTELAKVLPEDIWLTSVTATVAQDVKVAEAAGVPLRGDAPGPALELVGCGRGHDSVARFLTRLEDIDGVTRVAVNRSQRPIGEGPSAPRGGGEKGDDCRTRDSVTRFEAVAAFDGVKAGTAALAPKGEQS